MIVMSRRKKLTKKKEASGNGLSGCPVDVLVWLIVPIKASSKSISPIVITNTLTKAFPTFLNASCKKEKTEETIHGLKSFYNKFRLE